MKPMRANSVLRQAGAGIVEVMVGILIGLLVVLVVYNLLSGAEAYKRTATGVADAQITGLFSQFVTSREAGNGGNGLALSADDLFNCIDVALRPIPLLITDGAAPDVSESFITSYSAASRVIWPVEFTVGAAANAPFAIQSPNGFRVNDRIVAIESPTAALGTGRCEMFRVTGIAGPDPFGVVTLTHSPPVVYPLANYAAGVAKLLNLGQVGLATRTLFDVVNAQLRSTDLLAAAPAVPIAANVVLMKVQYGIDIDADRIIDCWTPADNNNVCLDGINYTAASVQGFDKPNMNRILAVRIGVVVRSDEPDLKDPTLVFAIRPQVVLFNCSVNTNAACQSRVVVPNTIIQDGFRYRTYETIIPLRNAIYHAV